MKKISNFNPPDGGQISNSWQSQVGFTLIELLVVVTLIAIIGLITTQVFVIGFSSLGKSEVLKEVKQSGDYAMSVIESMVRNASDITSSCNVNSKSLTVIDQQGSATIFDCSGGQISSVSGVPSVSYPLTSSNTNVPITSCNFRLVCPIPPVSPKYVFVNFTIEQAGSGDAPESKASSSYQTTISLRTY